MSTDKLSILGEGPVDTGQHGVPFLEVMRQRGQQYIEHIDETAPHVPNYEVELLIDGRCRAWAPVVLTSQADTPRVHMASCAVAALYANGRWRHAQTAPA